MLAGLRALKQALHSLARAQEPVAKTRRPFLGFSMLFQIVPCLDLFFRLLFITTTNSCLLCIVSRRLEAPLTSVSGLSLI